MSDIRSPRAHSAYRVPVPNSGISPGLSRISSSERKYAVTHVVASMLRFTRAHPLVVFFVLAFTLTWLIEIPDVLGTWGIVNFQPTRRPCGAQEDRVFPVGVLRAGKEKKCCLCVAPRCMPLELCPSV